MDTFLAVIPARIGSTRLPDKPLALIAGKPMVVRVYEAAVKSLCFDRIIVATDSNDVSQVIEKAGGEIMMTPSSLATGSDRVAFVSKVLKDYSVVVNIQGDEPFVTPSMLNLLVEPFKNGECPPISTLAFPLASEELEDPNIVKVLLNKKREAIYFSRSPIPYKRNSTFEQVPVYHHMGLYAYKRDFLMSYTEMEQTPLEICESLEQLRALENGYSIRVNVTDGRTLEINTPAELAKAQIIAKEFFKNYT